MKKIILWIATLSWASYTFYLTTIPNFQPSSDTFISWLLSNGGHFSFFGILATLIFFALPNSIRRLRASRIAISTSSLYGLVIEFLQMRIPGRTADPIDWILDTVGATICIWIAIKVSHRKV